MFQIDNKEYILLNDSFLLVIAQWATTRYPLTLAYSENKPNFKSMAFRVHNKNSNYYWLQEERPSFYSTRPSGIITGASYRGTLFKYFSWVFHFKQIQVSPLIIKAMVSTAMGDQGFESLPNPLTTLSRSWTKDSSGLRQHAKFEASGTDLIRLVLPRGEVQKDPDLQNEMIGISIESAPPARAVIQEHIIKPFSAVLPNLRKQFALS